MNPSTMVGIMVALISIVGILITAVFNLWTSKVKNKADLEAKKTPDVTQLEVTHITAQGGYIDDLRADITALKADIASLKTLERDAGDKWFKQQTELLDKQKQIDKLTLQGESLLAKAQSLEQQLTCMQEEGEKHKADCQEQISGLLKRIDAIEQERDAWRERYKQVAGAIGGEEEARAHAATLDAAKAAAANAVVTAAAAVVQKVEIVQPNNKPLDVMQINVPEQVEIVQSQDNPVPTLIIQPSDKPIPTLEVDGGVQHVEVDQLPEKAIPVKEVGKKEG